MSRHLEPFQENPFIEIGRLLSKEAYKRDRKEIMYQTPEQQGGMIIDLIKTEEEEIVIGEVKKSSHYEQAAKMQLAFYLYRLKLLGIKARGQLLFPIEKRRLDVDLTEEIEKELIEAQQKIREIISLEKPPEPKLIKYCKKCGYEELCWS